MKTLLDYLLKGILGAEPFEVSETEDDGRIIFSIKTDPKNVGLIIGKGGKMIKNLRNLLKVKATLEKKAVAINITD